jgi:HAE1 family hydrophobic/amphiphilic exporter-1
VFLTRISVDHPVFATMMMLALVVIGAFAYPRLGVDQYPEVDFPVVAISTAYPGASAESVESEVTRPLEEAINTISGIDELISRSFEGRSIVTVQFDLSVDGDVAVQDVRDKVSAVEATFRDEIDKPLLTRFDPDAFPVFSLAVRSDVRGLRELTTLADQVIVKRLNTVPGVGRATIAGGVEREIQIQLDPLRMQTFGVGVDEVLRAVRLENQDLPAGSLVQGRNERLVEVRGRLEAPADFLDIPVARRGDEVVHLGQVASLIDGQAEQESMALLDGEPALAIDVVKVQGANTIAVAEGVLRAVEELRDGGLPSGVELQVVRDSARPIRASVDNVQRTLIEGAALTVLIVFLFLNSWRSTVITGLTLPVSVIGTFAALYFFGFTLNTMTLMALSLAIGILIDDAIVVRENITRHLARGSDHRRAALEGTKEIGLAVLATTLSIVAVFLPVAFMGGLIGRFFLQFGITVAVAVLISLFVSFTLDPMLSSVWYDPHASATAKRGPIGRAIGRFDAAFERLGERYRHVIRWSLAHRAKTLGIAAATLLGSFALVPWVGTEFVPAADLGEMNVGLRTPVGSSLDYTAVKTRQVQRALAEFPEVDYTYGSVNTGGAIGTNEAAIYVKLLPIRERDRSPDELAVPFRERLARIPGIELSIAQVGVNNGGQKPIQVSIQGPDLRELERISDTLLAEAGTIRGLVDAESSLREPRPVWSIALRRDAARHLGVGLQEVADTLRPLIAGTATSAWKAPDGETYDVRVRLPETGRESLADLDALAVAAPGLRQDGGRGMIPLRQIADIVPASTPSAISRRALSREVLISANVAGRPLGEVSAALEDKIKSLSLAPGYRTKFGGDTQDMNETLGHAMSALGLAVVFLYLILASQFGSFLQPIAIMASLPLALIGVFVGLLLWGSTLNIFSAIGFIMLMGLVTKNAILLVDFANQACARGASIEDALIEAGPMRLRPITMTTLAMIFGMLPLALGLGEGGEARAPMAHAVIGGLISSTLLTLVVVPVVLSYLDAFAQRARRYLPAAPADASEAAHAHTSKELPAATHATASASITTDATIGRGMTGAWRPEHG